MKQNPYQILKLPSEVLEKLSLGEVKPLGWLKTQMQNDLAGYIGHLNELVPDLIQQDAIYGANRLSRHIKNKKLGVWNEGGKWQIQFLWWNSETQSNWRDAWMRQIFLVGKETDKAEVKTYIEQILETQDEDGYLGIYDQDLRYQFDTENGELWAKATLYRVLLAYYEATQDEKVRQAVVRAVENVMQNYPLHQSAPFKTDKGAYAGLAHGLMFTDILDRLAYLTKEPKYQEYALFLYQNYAENEVPETDIQLFNILNPTYRMKGHGAHTYEHLRALLTAFYASGNPILQEALSIYLNRVLSLLTPSGGAIGDEYISERNAHASDTGYEYCSLQELLDSLGMMLQKSGDLKMAEIIERLFYNAAQGARHPKKQGIAYLKTDNSFEMLGKRNGELDDKGEKQTRYKYSPVHQDIAVCCAPNSGRIAAYFTQMMLMRHSEGLALLLWGAFELQTSFKGKAIHIQMLTNYPFNHDFNFEIESEIEFRFKLRKPAWVEKIQSRIEYDEKDGFIIFQIQEGKTQLQLTFETRLKENDFAGENYFTYGALVYALPIEAEERITKNYPLRGFHDYEYAPLRRTKYEWIANHQAIFSENQIFLQLKNSALGQIEHLRLIPMAQTILRQVTF